MRLVFIVSVIAAVLAGACFAQSGAINGLIQGVRTTQPRYRLGEQIAIEYAVRNGSNTTTALSFPTAKQFDIWVMQGSGEVFRASKGKVYAQTPTSIVLKPGETHAFTTVWDQRDMIAGRQVGPGVYTVNAQLTSSGERSAPVASCPVRIGTVSARAALVPLTVCEAVAYAPGNLGRRVSITATYRGQAPDSTDANTRPGPPVTRDDWVICDTTGCMYVTGTVRLDPVKDVGTRVTVVGNIARTDSGQVYLIMLSATTPQGSICPR